LVPAVSGGRSLARALVGVTWVASLAWPGPVVASAARLGPAVLVAHPQRESVGSAAPQEPPEQRGPGERGRRGVPVRQATRKSAMAWTTTVTVRSTRTIRAAAVLAPSPESKGSALRARFTALPPSFAAR